MVNDNGNDKDNGNYLSAAVETQMIVILCVQKGCFQWMLYEDNNIFKGYVLVAP